MEGFGIVVNDGGQVALTMKVNLELRGASREPWYHEIQLAQGLKRRMLT